MGTDRAAGPTATPVSCACGRRPGTEDRFCAGCGRPVDGGGADPELALLIDDRRPGRAGQTRDEVRTRFPTRAVLAAGAAVLCLLLAWSLFQGPSDEVAPEPRDDRATEEGPGEDDGAEPEPTTTTSRPSTSMLPQDEEAEGTETGDLDGEDPPSGPLLGEPTGLTLVAGHPAIGRVQLLDLDTGVPRELETQRGAPLAVLGSHLVSRHNEAIRITDLADPAQEAVVIGSGPSASAWTEFAGIDDDRVWVYEQDFESYSARLVGYDVEGTVQDEIDRSELPGFFGWSALHLDIVFHPAGGIYQREGDGFARRSGGLLLAVGDELVLVHECDEAMSCQSRWLDKSTWTDPGHPPPPSNELATSSAIAGSDRWLVLQSWESDVVRLIEIATGAVVREMPNTGFGAGLDGFSPPMTGDGRWLVDGTSTSAGGAVVVDLDSGREWPIPLDLRGDWHAVFVESSALGPVEG